jgi:hypothetical protein
LVREKLRRKNLSDELRGTRRLAAKPYGHQGGIGQ